MLSNLENQEEKPKMYQLFVTIFYNHSHPIVDPNGQTEEQPFVKISVRSNS